MVTNLALVSQNVCSATPFHHDIADLHPDCDRRLDVVNRGLSGWHTPSISNYRLRIDFFPGYTTANVLKILPHLIPSPACEKVDYLVG